VRDEGQESSLRQPQAVPTQQLGVIKTMGMLSIQSTSVIAAALASACATAHAPAVAPAPVSQSTGSPAPGDKPIDISMFKHARDDEPANGNDEVAAVGETNASGSPVAPVNSGEVYWRNLVAEVHRVWDTPTISKVNRAAVGCFHISPNGKIAATKLDEHSGNDALDESIQRAMTSVQTARNDHPQPVPIEQLDVIKKWICFRFNASPQ
jgi:TonB C terminal